MIAALIRADRLTAGFVGLGLLCAGSLAAANQPPVILEARATPNPMLWNQPVTYTVAAQDAEGDALTYRWLFADGLIATNAIAHTVIAPEGRSSHRDAARPSA